MARLYYSEAELYGIEIFGELGLYSDLRIYGSTVPKGLYKYECRDECDGDINEISEGILVNYFCTVIFNRPIDEFAPKDNIWHWDGDERRFVNVEHYKDVNFTYESKKEVYKKWGFAEDE